jgi:hypothetical protein
MELESQSAGFENSGTGTGLLLGTGTGGSRIRLFNGYVDAISLLVTIVVNLLVLIFLMRPAWTLLLEIIVAVIVFLFFLRVLFKCGGVHLEEDSQGFLKVTQDNLFGFKKYHIGGESEHKKLTRVSLTTVAPQSFMNPKSISLVFDDSKLNKSEVIAVSTNLFKSKIDSSIEVISKKILSRK